MLFGLLTREPQQHLTGAISVFLMLMYCRQSTQTPRNDVYTLVICFANYILSENVITAWII